MQRWRNLIYLGGLSVLGIAMAVVWAGGTRSTAVGETTTPSPDGKLIVHEWGTFTSFSGSNGAQLDFRPLVADDLPWFVSTRELHAGIPIFTKGRIRARIRMETPVTYFYTDVERTVRASVQFPSGLLTEFYPPVLEMWPKFNATKGDNEPFGNSKLDWGEIRLIPPANMAPAVKDDQARAWLRDQIEQRVLPSDGNPANHYYHARNTDSALIHVHHDATSNGYPFTANYLEKFLFYRGLGRFDQPLQVKVSDDNKVTVTNTGPYPINSLFRVTVKDKLISYSKMDLLNAGATAEFVTDAVEISLQELQDQVAQALVREKLYPREATAMVNTWADSWFAEEGTRIFYMVPGETTDKLLPLTISPPPDETVRVLVGRVEVLPPSVEHELLEVVRANIAKREQWWNEKRKAESKDATPPPIPAELLKLGRLAEPALVRIRELAKDDAVSYEAANLLRECQEALNKPAQ